jgi:hypothetical protein
MSSLSKEDFDAPLLIQRLRKYARDTRAFIGPVNPCTVNSALERIACEAEQRAERIQAGMSVPRVSGASHAQAAA